MSSMAGLKSIMSLGTSSDGHIPYMVTPALTISMDDSGMDITEMSKEDVEAADEVFTIGDGRYLVVGI